MQYEIRLCAMEVYKMKHRMFRNVQSSSARLFAKIDGEIFMWQRVKIFIYKNEGLLECMWYLVMVEMQSIYDNMNIIKLALCLRK